MVKNNPMVIQIPITEISNCIGVVTFKICSNAKNSSLLINKENNTRINVWGTILYLAGMSRIDPTFYEAARIDGASKLTQIRTITLPLLAPIISLNLILKKSSESLFLNVHLSFQKSLPLR